MSVLITPSGRVAVPERRSFPFAGNSYNQLGWSLSQNRSLELVGTDPISGAKLSYSYAKIYKTQPWVFTVVNKLAKAVAMLPLKVYGINAAGDRERVRDGDLLSLLEKPLPNTTAYEFKFSMVGSLAIYGNFLAIKTPKTPGGKPAELLPIQWSRVELMPYTTGEGREERVHCLYVIRDRNGKQVPFNDDEVVHIASWNVEDGFQGQSALEPLRRTLAIEDAAARETEASFKNGVRPMGMISGGPESKRPTKDDIEALRTQAEEMYGGPDRASRVAIGWGGMDWKTMQFSHKEAELIPVRKLSREEVCAAFDVPPPMVGILDRATFSNITEQHRQFYMDTLGPWLVQIEEALERQLLEPEASWKNLDLEFDTAEVLKGDVSKRADAYMKMMQVGFTPDEIRHLENAPPLGTRLSRSGFVQKNLMALADEIPVEAVPEPTP